VIFIKERAVNVFVLKLGRRIFVQNKVENCMKRVCAVRPLHAREWCRWLAFDSIDLLAVVILLRGAEFIDSGFTSQQTDEVLAFQC
jgi:hypothetical protein